MYKSYAVLTSGERLFLCDAISMVPCMVFATDIHIEVCETIATNSSGLSSEEHKVYVNLLARHSQKVSQLTALVFLNFKGVINVREIVSDYITNDFLNYFPNCNFRIDGEKNTDLIDTHHKYRFLIKTVLHKIYRLVSNRKLKIQNSTIRTWVEISERMYPEDFPNANILIYPFTLNIKRHLNFIRSTYGNCTNVSLMGLPYSLIDAFKVCFSKSGFDSLVTKAESKAFSLHASELSMFTAKSVKTSDEFEAGSVVMCAYLRSHNIEIVNTAHGISFDCPYVGYSKFFVYNEPQADFYKQKSKNTEFEIKVRKNCNSDDFVKTSTNFTPVVILIHGDYKRSSLLFEHALQTDLFNATIDVCYEYSIPVFIKVHPNATPTDLKQLENWKNTRQIRSLSELQEGNPIFVNLNSVSYYDFKDNGPFVFIEDGIVSQKLMFGDEIETINLKNIENSLPMYFDKKYWLQKFV